MSKWKILIGVFVLGLMAGIATQGFAKQIDLGNHSAEEISGLCHQHGGEFLGVSDSGSYGCEYKDTDTVILCNKSGSCTGYTSAKTVAEGQRILNINGIKGKATVMKSSPLKSSVAAKDTKEGTNK